MNKFRVLIVLLLALLLASPAQATAQLPWSCEVGNTQVLEDGTLYGDVICGDPSSGNELKIWRVTDSADYDEDLGQHEVWRWMIYGEVYYLPAVVVP